MKGEKRTKLKNVKRTPISRLLRWGKDGPPKMVGDPEWHNNGWAARERVVYAYELEKRNIALGFLSFTQETYDKAHAHNRYIDKLTLQKWLDYDYAERDNWEYDYNEAELENYNWDYEHEYIKPAEVLEHIAA